MPHDGSTVVFWDLASTHVYGHHGSIAKNGYSRPYHPDLAQIELGLLVTLERLPLLHGGFAGNMVGKATVKKILTKLKETFQVDDRRVFVGRGTSRGGAVR